jgi:hypothetical protein
MSAPVLTSEKPIVTIMNCNMYRTNSATPVRLGARPETTRHVRKAMQNTASVISAFEADVSTRIQVLSLVFVSR